MENRYNARQWLREAEGALDRARRLAADQDWVGCCQQAQLCVEYSAKAVIACFEAQEWTHDPSQQLLRVIQANGDDILSRFGEGMVQRLQVLASDAREASPWHGWSTYGRTEEGLTTFPTDLCTQRDAERLLDLSERSFPTASQFVLNWLNP